MQQIISPLRTAIRKNNAFPIEIALGMHYGNPSIQDGLEELRQKNVTCLVVDFIRNIPPQLLLQLLIK